MSTLWPSKVFIDNTALRQLGPRLETVDLAKILSYRGLNAEFYIPEVSWEEFIRHRKDDLRRCLDKIHQSEVALQKYELQIPELLFARKKVEEDYLPSLRTYFNQKAENLGLIILETSPIDLRKLLRMSLDCTPPFERSKEKGFRDSLIMFTVLEKIRDRSEDNAVLISADQLLAKGCQRVVEEYNTRLHIAENFDEAVKYFESQITGWYLEKLRGEADEAKTELNKYKDEISSAVQEIHEVSEVDLGQGMAAALAGTLTERIEEVLALSLVDIKSAIWKDKDQPQSRILFNIRCEAKVKVEESALQIPSYTVGGGVAQGGRFSYGTTERNLPVTFYGQAEFTKIGNDWNLKELRIDRKALEPEDLILLRQAQK